MFGVQMLLFALNKTVKVVTTSARNIFWEDLSPFKLVPVLRELTLDASEGMTFHECLFFIS